MNPEMLVWKLKIKLHWTCLLVWSNLVIRADHMCQYTKSLQRNLSEGDSSLVSA